MKVRKSFKEFEEVLRSHLGLKYRLVGIKLIKDNSKTEGGFQPKVPMAFCHMVRLASVNGDKFLYNLELEKCPTAQTVLGFKSLRYFKTRYRTIPEGTRKIFISPFGEIGVAPDVVIAVLTPKQMMDLAIIFHALESRPLSAELTGEHACSEFFVRPYMDGEPKISLLCSGAREVYSDYRDTEIIFGAPLEVYVRVAEMVKRLNKMGGALCGCRTSDIPLGIIDEFEKIGFSRGTDYFFGRVNGRNIRVYLDKNMKGKIGFITIHLAVRASSEEEAERLSGKLKGLMPKLYFANNRGCWLDLSVKSSCNALGIDLFDGSSLKAAIENFINRVNLYLNKGKV